MISITMPNAGRWMTIGMPAICGAVCRRPCTAGIGAQERRPIAGRQPGWQIAMPKPEQRVEVVAPRDRDRDVADGVFEDQIPADDPRDELTERRVRVGVGASGLRNHRRQLRVAERRERARHAEQQEREDQRRAGAVRERPRRSDRPARRPQSDRAEDAGPDDRSDRQHDQVAGAEHPFQPVLAVDQKIGDGFAREELTHVECRQPTTMRARDSWSSYQLSAISAHGELIAES